jgi:hypothetical protein
VTSALTRLMNSASAERAKVLKVLHPQQSYRVNVPNFLILLVCVLTGPFWQQSTFAVSLDDPGQANTSEGPTTVIPTINYQADRLWADGTTPVVMWISLEVVRGQERWPYTPTEEFIFNLGPSNSSFSKATVNILPGQNKSSETRLTVKQQGPVVVTCTQDRPHEGVTVLPCQPVRMDFVFPINLIAIEPVKGESPINIGRTFRVFLSNQNNPQAELPPLGDVPIQLFSDNGNGNISESDITLNSMHSSHLVRYRGTRLGTDAILANATYLGGPLKGNSPRMTFFPWWTFLIGSWGAVLGSLLRCWVSGDSKKLKAFVEALGCGLIFCLIVILFPVGTKLGIEDYVQPWLVFSFAFLVSLIPEAIKKVIPVFG